MNQWAKAPDAPAAHRRAEFPEARPFGPAMQLQFCDRCGKPLSEGCLARGEAVENGNELICTVCNSSRRSETSSRPPGPLGHYETAVWRCVECGIPVNALDLIEGRAVRAGEAVTCARCRPVGARTERPSHKPRAPRLSASAASAPRHRRAAAQSYVTEAQGEQQRPILPILLFSIVFVGFAASLFFAITSQYKLDQAMNGQVDREADAPGDNSPPVRLNPPTTGDAEVASNPEPEPPDEEDEQPPPSERDEDHPAPSGAGPVPIPPDVMDDLVELERDLAAPVNELLASADLGDVLEGLILAGSRRLIGCRGHVRALLDERDDQIRAAACRVAAMLDDAEALPRLSRMAETDPSPAVQTEAKKARGRMTGQATREIRDLTDEEIEEMLEDLRRELERRRGSNE